MPFPDACPVSRIHIGGQISRVSSRLAIQFELSGDLSEVMIPGPAQMPARKFNLWTETCFEFFIAVKDSSRYREFNLSPAGHWNVFCFALYRTGMKEDTIIGSLPFVVRHQPSALLLSLDMDMNRFIRPGQVMETGLCAVIKYKSGEVSYWALSHPGQQADFHRRESFVITI